LNRTSDWTLCFRASGQVVPERNLSSYRLVEGATSAALATNLTRAGDTLAA